MKNYQDSKIYAIMCPTTKNVYIGSTTEPLSIRLSKHKYESVNPTRPNFSSGHCLKHKNYSIKLIEKYPCNNSIELESRESLYIIKYRLDNNINCVNERCPQGHKKMVYDLSSLPSLSFDLT